MAQAREFTSLSLLPVHLSAQTTKAGDNKFLNLALENLISLLLKKEPCSGLTLCFSVSL